MTNVPEPIRDAWKDLYILFDKHYAMTGTEDEWEKFWLEGCEIIKKHGDDIPLLESIQAIAHMIETFINQRKTGNKSLTWDANEPYPHPKEGKET